MTEPVDQQTFRDAETAIWDKIDRINNVLHGSNGSSHGVVTRVSLVENDITYLREAEQSRRRREWSVIIGLVMLLLKAGWEMLRG